MAVAVFAHRSPVTFCGRSLLRRYSLCLLRKIVSIWKHDAEALRKPANAQRTCVRVQQWSTGLPPLLKRTPAADAQERAHETLRVSQLARQWRREAREMISC